MFKNPFITQPIQRPRFSGFSGPDLTQKVMSPDEVPAQQPGLMDRYNQLINKHPYLDQLNTEMQNDPKEQDYKIGKVGRLGAILAGASTSFLNNPAEGIKLQNSIIDDKYNKARELHKEKVNNLGNLASMERDGLGDQVKGLELENNINNQNREFGLKKDQATEQRRVDDAQIGNLTDEGLHRGEYSYTDKTSGHMFRVDGKGVKTDLGKVDQTPGEILADELKKVQAQGDNSARVANIGASSRESIAANRETRLNNFASGKGGPKQNERIKAVITEAMNSGLGDMIDVDPVKGPYVVDGNSYINKDTTERATQREELRKALIEAAKAPVADNNPKVMSKQQVNPATKETRTVYSYDGGKTWGVKK
jgi:hypothetical protein